MRTLLQLAAFAALAATATSAQIVNPDTLVASPPHNPARAAAKPAEHSDALQWLWQYAQPAPAGNKAGLLADARFNALLHDDLRAPQAFWSAPGSPLADAARAFLAGPGTISSADNRHIIITGCVVDHCPQRGLLYADLGEPDPLVVFAALRWAEQTHTTDEPGAPFNLWLFTSRPLDGAHIPEALRRDLAGWLSNAPGCNRPTLSSVLLVDPSGVPHVISILDAGLAPQPCTPLLTGPHA